MTDFILIEKLVLIHPDNNMIHEDFPHTALMGALQTYWNVWAMCRYAWGILAKIFPVRDQHQQRGRCDLAGVRVDDQCEINKMVDQASSFSSISFARLWSREKRLAKPRRLDLLEALTQ